MTFTLVIMAHERPDGLRRCLASIAALGASRDSFEVVVVDDGSKTDLASVVAEFEAELPISYLRRAHRGVAATRNAGLSVARGEFVAFLADDYALPPDYLAHAEGVFARHPEVQVLTFNMRSRGASIARYVQQAYIELMLLQNAQSRPDEDGFYRSFHLPAGRAAIFRRSVFALVGPFTESLAAGEDGEMGARLAEAEIPVHFDSRYYIDHWEQKSLRGFLRQRVAYATSFHEVLSRGHYGRGERRWPLRRCVREVLGRVESWAQISRETGRAARFVAVLPGLFLFLSCFYGTLWRLDRAGSREALERATGRAAGRFVP